MRQSLCPQPGLARRGETYPETVEACARSGPDPNLNRLMIDKALALGTGDALTAQERCLMMALLAHLDIAATASGDTAVWPGARRLCTLLGIGESTLRRLKGSLEEKGFILRRYDRRNQPLRGGAIDLRPFLLKVPQLCNAIGHTESLIAADRATLAGERYDHVPDESAPALNCERAIRNPPVQTSERPPEVAEAVEAAERICPGLPADPETHAEQILGGRKARRLWPWALRRHGEAACLALAIAGHDPRVKDPAAWFGWYATAAGEVDLLGIAERLAEKAKRAAPIEAPADPLAAELMRRFAERAGEAPALSYLGRAVVETQGDMLTVRTTGRTAAERLSRHAHAMKEAASALGFSAIRIVGPELAAPFDEGKRRPDEPRRKGAAGQHGPATDLAAKGRNLPEPIQDGPSVRATDGGRSELQDEGEVDQKLERQEAVEEKRREGLGSQPDAIAMPVVDGETAVPAGDT